MPTLDTSTMRTFARLLISDDRASRNDAEILTRALKDGETDRVGLDAARDEIDRSDLPMDRKRVALRKLEAFLDASATGVEAEFYSASPALMRSLKWNDIHSAVELLEKGATPAQRESLAREIGTDEKQIRALVKQADLRRLDGVDGKLASVLLDVGIDSVPELGNRNAANLLKKLREFQSSQDGYITGFQIPQSGTGTAAEKELQFVQDLVSQADALDKVVVFGKPTVGLQSLSNLQRAEMFYAETLDHTEWTGSAVAYLQHAGVPNPQAVYDQMKSDAMAMLSDELDYWDIDVSTSKLEELGSYDALLDHVTPDEADSLGNGWAAFEPTIYVFKDDAGKEVGASISFSRNLDGDHEYGETHIHDALAGKMTGYVAWGYEMTTEFNF